MKTTRINGFLVPKFLQMLHSEFLTKTSLSRFSRDQVASVGLSYIRRKITNKKI